MLEKYSNKIFLRCQAYGINLWIKDIMKHKWTNNVLEKSKHLALYFCNYQILLVAFYKIQKEKYEYEIALTLIVKIR